MIEEIRTVAAAYYASVKPEQFAADLRKAGFTVLEIERVGHNTVQGRYLNPDIDFGITNQIAYGQPIKHTEMVELPQLSYRLSVSCVDMGPVFNEDAA